MKIALTVHSTTEPTQEVIDFLTSKGDVKYVIRNEVEGNFKEFIIDKNGNRFDMETGGGEVMWEKVNGNGLNVFEALVKLVDDSYNEPFQYHIDQFGMSSYLHEDVINYLINEYEDENAANIYQQIPIAMADFAGMSDQEIGDFFFEFFTCAKHAYNLPEYPTTVEEFLTFNLETAFTNESFDEYYSYLNYISHSQFIDYIDSYQTNNLLVVYEKFYNDPNINYADFTRIPELTLDGVTPKSNKVIYTYNTPINDNEVVNLAYLKNVNKDVLQKVSKSYIPLKGIQSDNPDDFLEGELKYKSSGYISVVDNTDSIDNDTQNNSNATYSGYSIRCISTKNNTPVAETAIYTTSIITNQNYYGKRYESHASLVASYSTFNLQCYSQLDSVTEEVTHVYGGIRIGFPVKEDNPHTTWEGILAPLSDGIEDIQTDRGLDYVIQRNHLKKSLDLNSTEVKTLAKNTINGKPIYRKTLLIPNNASTSADIDMSVNVPDLELLLEAKAFSGKRITYNSSYDSITDNLTFDFGQVINGLVYVVLEYTKTTD